MSFGLFGLVVVLLAVLEAAAAQTTHIVLDNQGWIIPQGGAVTYTTWVRCFGLFGLVVVLLAVLEAAAAQTTHIVLDNQGWIIPQGGAAAYTTWAATKTFMVGDTLVFNFANRQHDIAQVTQTEFDACTSTSTIGSILMTGPANITLTTAGNHYYICTFSGHCTAGQKLVITVFGKPSAAAPPMFVTAPTAGGPATECPTTESTGPTAAAAGPTMPPANSASFSNKFGSLFVILLPIVANIIL